MSKTYAPSELESLKFIRFLEDYFGYRIPWGMSGALRIAQHVLGIEEIPWFQRYLPSMVKYGVDHPTSTWVMSIGCPSRDLATRIATRFLADGRDSTNFTQFIEWVSRLTEEDLIFGFGATSNQARGLLQRSRGLVPNRRDFVATVRAPDDVLYGRLMGTQYEQREIHAVRLAPSEVVELRRDYGNPYDRNAIAVYARGVHVGFVDKRLARLLATELDCGLIYTVRVRDMVARPRLTVNLEFSRQTEA